MARSNQDKEDLNPAVTNGFTCHVENGISLCSHSSKRKRLQKPKVIKEDDKAQIVVENLFKSEHCLNHGRKKLINVKPCRRSERKIIPSSLWDNAVINPFFERKRRRLADSPVKSAPNSNGIISNDMVDLNSDQDQKCNGHLDISENVSSEEVVDNDDDNQTVQDGEQNGDKHILDCQGHVRLRRSSRKHSSSVSSMIDSKYAIKQEHLQKITLSAENSVDKFKTGSPQYGEQGDETLECKADPLPLEHTLPLPNGRASDHEPLSETDLKNQDDSMTCNDINDNEEDVATVEVSGCEANYKSVDDEIDVKRPVVDTGGDEERTSGTAPSEDIPEEEKVYVDSLGRRGKKRGRRSRPKPILNHSESEESLQAADARYKLKSPDNEITVSKDVMTSKEALQLIDGSSFQRFYKMRTRRQTSSTEQTPGSTPVIKRRASSRSNSGTSKNSEETTSSETKKRTKQVKPDILCSFCLQTEDERGEEMISCCLCGASGHPSCLQFSVALTQRVKLYDWECIECKKCELCRNSGDDATLLFCDDCDKGFHMNCLDPPLAGEPDGHWSCLYCVEGSDYWKNRSCRTRPHDKSRKGKKSDKISKRKQLLDDLAMFHEAQSRAQAAMTEEAKTMPKLKAPRKKGTVPPTIKTIELGCYEITAWYSSPYPAEYALQSKLYICEFCLKYMKSGVIASRHLAKCPARCPPGDEIYRKDTISVFEVDGRKNKTYCQNLCLLAKLFLDHKTLYYDVEPFLFYILTEYDRKGCHLVGYFSKEKNSFLSYNVSCILVLPPYMKKGYGKMLIDFSYALSRNEGKLGSPEKPLSDLGLVSYRNYWKEKLLEYFLTYTESEITIKHISQTLGFNPYDIVSTLQAYGMIKYHKSNHYVLKRPEMLAAYKRKQATHAGLPCRSIDMSRLMWTPPQQRENK